MSAERIKQVELFETLPPEWPEDLLLAIQERVRQSGRKVVVLDDDPTGTQTVHQVPVLTEWPVERLVDELQSEYPVFYLLTNSRSLSIEQARALNNEIGSRLVQAVQHSRLSFALVSRSDSTLRGHFPGEVEALAVPFGQSLAGGLADVLASALTGEHANPFDAWLIVPFFPEGGRYTVNDIHYVAEGEWLVPAGDTQFARDMAFGYQSSNLRDWVTEKTEGKIPADEVASISIEDLRQGGPERVTERLLALPRGAVCIVNAASYRDLEVLVLGILDAEARGRRFLYRTASPFVRVRAGLSPRPLLTAADLGLPEQGPGLLVVGSHVPKTTAQLERLVEDSGIAPIEIRAERLLDPETREDEIGRVLEVVNERLAAGRDTVVYTSRGLISGDTAERSLSIGQAVSDSLVALVQGLQTRPRYLLAKGGITSSDLATRGLGIRRAIVLGQILPGVPVWQAGPESRYPGLAYIVFPGNVGETDSLTRIVKDLKSR